jgi:hypothetical protein
MRIIALTGVLAALAAGAAQGQSTSAGPVTIAPLVGYMKWDDGAGLDNSPLAGLSATYRVRGGLALGAFLEGGRPVTLGRYFPASLLNTAGSTQLFLVSQRTTLVNYGARAQYGMNVGGGEAYLSVGLGQYTVFPDVQQTGVPATFSGMSWETGAGFGVSLGQSASVRFDARAVHFRKWDRARLNPVEPAYRNTLYPDVQDYPLNVPKLGCDSNASGAGNYCSLLNWRLGVAFVFYPQGAGR